MKKLLLGYIALVLSFQYAPVAWRIVDPFLEAFGPATRHIVGWFLFWLVLWWGLVAIYNRGTRPTRNGNEEGCLTALLVFVAVLWIGAILASKMISYIEIKEGFPAYHRETAAGAPVTLDPDEEAILRTLLRHEPLFDMLIQFWMPPGDLYFLHGVTHQYVCSEMPQLCSGVTP